MIRITSVSEPTDKRKDGSQIIGFDGQPRHYFTLEVAAEDGLRDISARRNFWVENRDTINHARAKKAMEAGADVSSTLSVVTVETEPRSWVDAEGKTQTSTRATLIVLKDEPLGIALRATFGEEARLKGETVVEEEFTSASM